MVDVQIFRARLKRDFAFSKNGFHFVFFNFLLAPEIVYQDFSFLREARLYHFKKLPLVYFVRREKFA